MTDFLNDLDRQSVWHAETEDYAPTVRAVARKYPPWRCYRSTENPDWHYKIQTYSHDKRTDEVRLTLVHASGDPMAGVATFGQPAEQLLPCDCGAWQAPTQEEIARTRARLGAGCAHGCAHAHHSPWNPDHSH